LFPLLTVASVATIAAYLRSVETMDRRIGWAGVTLVMLAMATHLLGTPRAYLERNRIDARPIVAAMQSNIRILVADEEFTAQLLLPLYYRKIVFLADTPEQGSRLAA